MKTLCLNILLVASAYAADIKPVLTADEAASRAVVVSAQTTEIATKPRYFQVETPVTTAKTNLTYTVERYTHGKFGEGYVINWKHNDGTNSWLKRENFGPATYVAQDWTIIGTNKTAKIVIQ